MRDGRKEDRDGRRQERDEYTDRMIMRRRTGGRRAEEQEKDVRKGEGEGQETSIRQEEEGSERKEKDMRRTGGGREDRQTGGAAKDRLAG